MCLWKTIFIVLYFFILQSISAKNNSTVIQSKKKLQLNNDIKFQIG